MTTADLPAVNATLNAISAVLLTTGYVFIRRKNIKAHKTCMISAVCTSVVFLTCYIVYHALHGSTRFEGPGPMRVVYFAILIPHVILAIAIVPMVIVTLVRALKGQFDRHAKLARRTLPLWLYVSVTGVIIYLMLYQMEFGG